MSAMVIDVLQPNDDAGFAQLFDIYRDAIDPSEQKAEAALRAMLGRETQLLLVAREGGAVIAFAILWLPADADIWSLEYIAVAPSHRGSGLGAEMFRASVAATARTFGIIEVEAPTGELQRRRIAFYGRLGCRRLGAIDYQLPLRTNGEPPPMWLLIHGGEAVADVARRGVSDWLSRMYAEIYAEAPDDPRIAQMLADDSERIRLTALPSTP
jgi:ribosomal protein S18 acetylase RimI-like enzyme